MQPGIGDRMTTTYCAVEQKGQDSTRDLTYFLLFLCRHADAAGARKNVELFAIDPCAVVRHAHIHRERGERGYISLECCDMFVFVENMKKENDLSKEAVQIFKFQMKSSSPKKAPTNSPPATQTG